MALRIEDGHAKTDAAQRGNDFLGALRKRDALAVVPVGENPRLFMLGDDDVAREPGQLLNEGNRRRENHDEHRHAEQTRVQRGKT